MKSVKFAHFDPVWLGIMYWCLMTSKCFLSFKCVLFSMYATTTTTNYYYYYYYYDYYLPHTSALPAPNRMKSIFIIRESTETDSVSKQTPDPANAHPRENAATALPWAATQAPSAINLSETK